MDEGTPSTALDFPSTSAVSPVILLYRHTLPCVVLPSRFLVVGVTCKSLLLGQVQLGLMAQGEHFMVFSGEMKPVRLLKRAVKQSTGVDRPTRALIEAAGEWMRERFWLFDLQGTAKLDRLIEVFTYAHRRYGCTHFVIDSLMMTDVPEDGPGAMTAQKDAMRKMTSFARRLNVHLHLVAHPRKQRDQVIHLWPTEIRALGLRLVGSAMQFAQLQTQHDMGALLAEATVRNRALTDRVSDLERAERVAVQQDNRGYGEGGRGAGGCGAPRSFIQGGPGARTGVPDSTRSGAMGWWAVSAGSLSLCSSLPQLRPAAGLAPFRTPRRAA